MSQKSNDHWNALIVQYGYSYWLQSCPTKQKPHKKQHLVCGDTCHHPKTWNTPQRHFEGVIKACQDLQWTHDAKYSSLFRNQRDRSKSCSTSKRRNSDSDGSECPARSMVGQCDDMFSYLGNMHDKIAAGKTAHENRCGALIDRLLIPIGAKVSYNLRKTRQGCISSEKNIRESS